MKEFISMVGIGVLVCGAFIVLCFFARLACEVFLSVEDRIWAILKIQKPIVQYLTHRKLYDKLMEEHLKAKGGAN